MYIKFAEDGKEDGVFRPTNEWQKVKKGRYNEPRFTYEFIIN